MVGLRLKRATNQVVCGGDVPLVEELKITTVTNMYPGRLVMKDTNDDDIILNTGMTPVGWLGYEQTNPEMKPETKAAIYTAGQVSVLKGGGFVVDTLAVDSSGTTIAKGAPLMPAATLGGVKQYDGDPSANNNVIVAYAEESVTVPSGGSVAILARSVI